MRERLQYAMVVAFALCRASAASAETIVVQLDWSQQPDGFEKVATDLQDRGQLAIPLVFIDGVPAGMLGDHIEIPPDKTAVKINVGSRVLRERPLYSFSWPPSDPQATTIVVDIPALSQPQLLAQYKDSQGALLVGDVETSDAQVTKSADGLTTITLGAKPYAAVVQAVKTTQEMIQWSDDKSIPLYRKDAASGRVQQLDEAGYASGQPASQVSQYAVIDAPWSTYQADIMSDWFKPQAREPLRIETQPAGAKVYLSGRLQEDETTNTVIDVMRKLWPEVTLRRGKDFCQVKETAIQPPKKPDDPPLFSCKLTH